MPWLAGAALAGLLLGLALISTAASSRGGGEPVLQFHGQTLPASAEAADVAAQRVEQRFEGWFNLELSGGERRPISYRALGVELDRARLGQMIRNARAGVVRSPRADSAESLPNTLELAVPVRIERTRLLDALLALKDDLDRSASDARLDLDHQAVMPEKEGRLLDVDRSSLAIERAIERGAEAAALAFEARSPRRLAQELAEVRYDALLGHFNTAHAGADRAHDRTFNLQRAASKLDGYVLMPGEELDFNAVVGPRDEANGYRVASILAVGEVLDGVGSSTSQLSGTLHAAALFAGLDVIERHPHVPPSPAIELGLDAVVAFPSINLRLKNPYDFPVVLRATVSAGRLRAEIRGARRPYTISVIRKIDAVTAFEMIEQPADELPLGTRVLAQRGVRGVDLHRYRIRRDGAHSVREVVMDRYPPTPGLVLVGTAVQPTAANAWTAPATGRPPQDAMPEYRVDDLLVMIQSSRVGGPLLQRSTPGRSQGSERTKDIGAPAWKSMP